MGLGLGSGLGLGLGLGVGLGLGLEEGHLAEDRARVEGEDLDTLGQLRRLGLGLG